jgi:arginase
LCFIDGHLDLLTPATSHSKGAAGMDLALALGHGPAVLADLDQIGPLVQEAHVAVLG